MNIYFTFQKKAKNNHNLFIKKNKNMIIFKKKYSFIIA